MARRRDPSICEQERLFDVATLFGALECHVLFIDAFCGVQIMSARCGSDALGYRYVVGTQLVWMLPHFESRRRQCGRRKANALARSNVDIDNPAFASTAAL